MYLFTLYANHCTRCFIYSVPFLVPLLQEQTKPWAVKEVLRLNFESALLNSKLVPFAHYFTLSVRDGRYKLFQDRFV